MGEIKIADILAMTVEERLDLIERVWDTLAETPEAIPVPDWHKDALAQRLRTFEQDPEEGASWDEVESRVKRRSVSLPLVIRPEAEADLIEAFDWYEGQRKELGGEFLSEVCTTPPTTGRPRISA